MDAEALDYPDDAFDVVVAQYVITAVPNPEAALDEFVRVVRPGGEIVISTRIGAEEGLRGTIETGPLPAARGSASAPNFPGPATRTGRHERRSQPDRAPRAAAVRSFLVGPIPQDRRTAKIGVKVGLAANG